MRESGWAIDLDETLAKTNLFWTKHHLRAYGSPEGLNAEEIIKKYRFVKEVPYWKIKEAEQWVDAHIDSNEAKLEIPVIEEAIVVMREIPVACYLTNRTENTIDGTRRWLKRYGFPEREILASNNGMEWKARRLEEMFPQVNGIIDDNEELLLHLNPKYMGRILLYSHSEPIRSGLNLIICPTWEEVRRETQRLR
ncbi:MAG: hypothetical protein V2A62_01170 [Candidatus Woesearchaeota archaeon]